MPVHQVSAAAMQPLPRDKRTWENHRSVVSNPSVQQTCVPPAVPTHSHQRRPEINDQRVNGGKSFQTEKKKEQKLCNHKHRFQVHNCMNHWSG